MKMHTTFRIGGNADIFVVPENENQAVAAINACRELSIPYTVIGNGSNLLVRDGGIRGAVIAFTS
ncbi:MAG: FAD-binding protein, partial [Clostridia bacterium]|nr:FAD-binding protein [Clostridia bacterium]